MTVSRAFLASTCFLAAFTAGAHATTLLDDRSNDGMAADGSPPMKLAQKIDGPVKEQIEKAKQEAAKKKKAAADAKAQAAQKNKDAAAAQQNAAKQKQLQAQQARENALKAKQDAAAARQEALKQKQLQFQAKDKTPKAKQDADAKQDFKQKQLQFQQAKDKALKDKQDAQNAARQQQLEALKAKENAAKAKGDADAARLKALKDRQDAAAARQKSIKDKLEAANKNKFGPVKVDRAKMDSEFDRARKQAQQDRKAEKFRPAAADKFERLRKERKIREVGKRNVIIEPDKRVIVRNDKRIFIRHDDRARFASKNRRELRRERRKDGTLMLVTMGLAGALIYTLQDDHGHVIRRSRRNRDGREFVLFDDRRYYRNRPRYVNTESGYYDDDYVDLPPPVVRIPRDRYIVEYDRASPDDLYDTLSAPPIEQIDRGYSLDEVRQNYSILERMRRVDLDSINFEFASWDVDPGQYSKLERMARAIQRVLDRSPGELFLIEGHTDAVGSEIDNLSLSDRRAEAVAMILSDTFGIPPENLTTQGYGEEYLKEPTDGPSIINRRVSVRRVTPLLSRDGWDDPS